MDKLEKVFSQAHYSVEKIYEGLRQPSIGKVGLDMVEGILGKFRSKLEERGLSIETYDSIKYIYKDLQYPLGKLAIYFESLDTREKPNIEPQTASIFQFFIGKKIEDLDQIAKEIDAEYSS